MTAGSSAFATEERKHQPNDRKCAELGWVSIPIVVEMYGCWGTVAKGLRRMVAGVQWPSG